MGKKDLVQIIKENPGCYAEIDNDCWVLTKVDPWSDGAPNEDDMSYDDYAEWEAANRLVSSHDDLVRLGDGGYGSGNCYGGDVLQALAKIVGVKVRSV